jgi:iron-sulfur cluster assembly accessory protein
MNTPESTTLVEPIALTESAAAAVRDLLTQRNLPDYALRVYVSGGGCSGLQHGLALEGHVRPEDTAFEVQGVKVVVDEVSIEYLRGSTVDYVKMETESGFKILNPNVLPSCNCGSAGAGGCCENE